MWIPSKVGSWVRVRSVAWVRVRVRVAAPWPITLPRS